MRRLSKSNLIAFRQCPKRLWLEIHRPELRDDSGSEAVFRAGNEVGEVARRVYDPEGDGSLIEIEELGYDEAFSRSARLLQAGEGPVFEAGLSIDGALAFADVMLPVGSRGDLGWRMLEVKSTTSVKDYHRDDLAIQAHLATRMGVRLDSAGIAHIDNRFVHQLSARFPELSPRLVAIAARIVDLHPIAKAHFYALSQHGSWSLKAVLPAACPELSYDTLEGVADGGMAVEAYREAIAPETTEERRHAIERELLAYCHLDTLALVRLWEVFRGGGSGATSKLGGG